MALTIYSDELSRFGYSREATFGTPIADNGAFKELIVPRGVRIDPAVVKYDMDQNRDSRIFHLADSFNDTFTNGAIITIPEMICTKDRFADMLYACMQSRAAEGAAALYQKVFTMNASQPDFTANAGYFFTLGWRGPVTAKHIKVTSCIVRKMEIDIDKTKKDIGNLVHLRNVEIIGKALTQSSTFSGTWTAPVVTSAYWYSSYGFTFTDITNTNATPQWLSFVLKIDNGAEIHNRDTDGSPKTYFLNPSRTGAVTVEMSHLYGGDTSTRDFIAALIANTQLNFSMAFKTTSDDLYILIACNGIVQGNPQASDDKKMVMPASYICGDTASLAALTITMNDSIQQT
jgi:hypothetical protein